MPRPPAPLPDRIGHAFSVPVARAAGISRGRLRAADLAAPYRGARLRRDTEQRPVEIGVLARDRTVRATVLARVAAYETVRRPHVFYTGRTAVVLYDRLFDDDDGEGAIEVAVAAPHRAPRGAGVRGRQLSPSLVFVREVSGLPVASPASVWAGLGAQLGPRELIRLGDALVRVPRGERGIACPEQQWATLAQLRAAAAIPGRRARPALERALAQVRVGSMSVLETDHRLACDAEGLPESLLDVEIRDARGRLLGIADAAYPDQHVLVEVEGGHHRLHDRQWNRDIDKHAAFTAAGWQVVRVTARHIRRRDHRSALIVADALRRGGWSG